MDVVNVYYVTIMWMAEIYTKTSKTNDWFCCI